MVGDQLRLISVQSPTNDMSLREVADPFPIIYKFRGFMDLQVWNHSTITFYELLSISVLFELLGGRANSAILSLKQPRLWGYKFIYPISKGIR